MARLKRCRRRPAQTDSWIAVVLVIAALSIASLWWYKEVIYSRPIQSTQHNTRSQ